MSDFKKMKEMVDSLKGLSKAKRNCILEELRNMIDAIGQCVNCYEIACLSKDGLCENCADRKNGKDRLKKRISDIKKRVLTIKAEKVLEDNRRIEEYWRKAKIQRERALDAVGVLKDQDIMALDLINSFPVKMPDSELFIGEPCLHISYRSKREGIAQGRLRCNLDGVNRLWLYDEDGKPKISFNTDEDVERFVDKYVDVRP